MSKYFLLLSLQIKTAFQSIPKLIGGSLIFAALVGLIGFSGTLLLDQNEESEKINIGLVLPDDGDQYTSLAFALLTEVDTIKNICNFIKTDNDTAFSNLKSGQYQAVILIPDNFVDHLMDGTNIPAEIILPKEGANSKSMLFRALIEAGATDISASQAGIYAVEDVCLIYKIKNGISYTDEKLSESYFSYALDRNVYFQSESVFSTGNLSVIEFYICTGIVLFFLLSGITAVQLLKKESPALTACLRRNGISSGLHFTFKVFGVSVVYFVFLAIIFLGARLIGMRSEAVSDILPNISFIGFLTLFLFIFASFSMVLFIFQFTKNESFGVLLLFLLTVVMLFASGAFIPSSLLPEPVQIIGRFLPTTYFLRLCNEVLANTVTWISCIINIGFSVLFLSGVSFLTSRRNA